MPLIAIAPAVPLVVGGVLLAGGAAWAYFMKAERRGALQPATRPLALPPGAEDPEDPNGPTEPTEAIIEAVIGRFDDAAFHQPSENNSVAGLASQVLGKIHPPAKNNIAQKKAMRRLLNRSAWNRILYGTPAPNDGLAFEDVHVNQVFLAKHEPALGTMRSGYRPERMISPSGTPLPGSPRKWGAPWVPALNHEAVIAGVTDPDILLAAPWPDGSPATEPPPEVLNYLKVRAA